MYKIREMYIQKQLKLSSPFHQSVDEVKFRP